MSQAQPLPPRNSGGREPRGRSRARPAATTGRRVARAAAEPTTQRGPSRRPTAGSNRMPLITFVVGLALGYGIAGAVPAALFKDGLAALLQGKNQLSALVNPLAGIGQQRILVIGVDHVGDNTDVILTAQVKDGQTQLLQVPRDTFVETERYGVLKANALYAYGGMEAARKELGHLLGTPLKGYLRVNLKAVERLADALGGVEVDVPKRMYYIDNAQGLYIDLYPGPQLLRGEELMGFLRYRNDEMGDLGRLERQKLVLREVFTKLAQPATLTRLPELLQIAGEDIETDLSALEMGQLLTAMAQSRLSTSQLPGRLFWHNDLSYWMPNNNPHYGLETAGEHASSSDSDNGASEAL
jgi:LCP family protein required for cell wall assembly